METKLQTVGTCVVCGEKPATMQVTKKCLECYEKDFKEKQEEKEPRFHYTQGAWEGEKYKETENLSTTEIAKRIREDIKVFKRDFGYPELKVSVRTQYYAGGSSIDVTIKDFGFNPYNPEWDVDAYSKGEQNSVDRYTKRTQAIIKSLEKRGNKYRYNDSDGMIDYFDTNFYYFVNVDYGLENKYLKGKQEKK